MPWPERKSPIVNKPGTVSPPSGSAPIGSTQPVSRQRWSPIIREHDILAIVPVFTDHTIAKSGYLRCGDARMLILLSAIGCAPLDKLDPDGDGYSPAQGDCAPLDATV